MLVAAGLAAAHRLVQGDFVWTVWGDRDLARSAVPWWALPSTGAELSYGVGAGTPGGAFGYALWLVQWIQPGPKAAWFAQVALDTLAAAVVGWSVRRHLGSWGGALAFATWLTVAPNALNQTQLWNPAWLPLFLAVATTAWIRVMVDRESRALVPWAIALALGAQMHVTAGVLALAMLPGLLLARPPQLLRGAAAAALGATLAYAPYLWTELTQGLPNTRMLGVAEQMEDLTAPLVGGTRPLQTLWSALVTLVGGPALDNLPSTLPRSGVVALATVGPTLGALALVWSWRRESDPTRRRLLTSVVLAVVISLVSLSRSRAYDFQTSYTSRYLIFMVPLVAWLAALAGDAVVRALTARPWARTLALTAILASVGVHLFAFQSLNAHIALRPLSWTHVARWTDALRQRGALDEAPSNTTFFSVSQRLTREKAVPIESLRTVPDHEILAVAPTEPCRFVAVGDWPDPQLGERLTEAALTEALAPDGPRVVSVQVDVSEPGIAIGTWRPDVGPCPSNLTQRYLLTPDERTTYDLGPSVPTDSAARLDDDGGDARWLVVLDPSHGQRHPTPRLYALVRVARSGDELDVALSSNQLRGIAWNGGFFENQRVRSVRLLVSDPARGDHEITLAAGVVGGAGVSAPLFARGVASADAALALRVDVEPLALQGETVSGPITTVEIPLPQAR